MPDLISDGEDIVIAEVKRGALNQDAFERYRISTPYTLYEFNSFQDILFSNLFNNFTSSLSGGAVTHNNTRKSYVLDCGTGSGNFAIAQTKSYWRYQSGKSQFIATSFLMKAAVASKIKRIGFFDSNNGIFLEQNGTTDIRFVLRSSVSGSVSDANFYAQSNWNVDRLDGNGGKFNPSGINLDLTKTQILIIDFQWLGVGIVRVGFDIDGDFITVHEFRNANNLTQLYMLSGSLPLRYEIRNSAASSAGDMEFMCGFVASEGGGDIKDLYGPSWSYTNVRTINAETPLVSIKPSLTFKSNNNRGTIYPSEITTYSASRDIILRVYYNATVTGGTYTSINTDSIASQNSTATSFSGGRLIMSLIGTTGAKTDFSSGVISNERLTTNFNASDADNILITAQSLSNQTDVYYGITWKEVLR